MVQVITREWEIAKTYIFDIMPRDGMIQLDWNDFQMLAKHHRPLAAVRVEDNISVKQLAELATKEILKYTSGKLSCFIMNIYHKEGEEIMMDEIMELAEQMKVTVEDNMQIKWGVSHKDNMVFNRGICIYAFE